MYLVMLETGGNQRYVFSSPRQRENIGGSFLLTMLAPWTHEIAAALNITTTRVSDSSGKTILTVPDQDSATRLIGATTRRVHAIAPGMDVTGVFMPLADPSNGTHINVTESDLRRIHSLASRYALSRPPAEARFPQIPFLQRAENSNLPAAPRRTLLGTRPPGATAHSLPSQVKRACAIQARNHLVKKASEFTPLAQLIGHDDALLMDSLKALEDAFDSDPENTEEPEPTDSSRAESAPRARSAQPIELSRIAVIHIDGNGVGAIMRALNDSKSRVSSDVFHREVGCPPDHAESLRRFLLEINKRFDDSVTHAFFTAWEKVARLWQADHRGTATERIIPVVPILMGGDDLTVLTEGHYALPFMEAYLRAYEEATADDALLRYLGPASLRASQSTGSMTAAAGAAIVPRNFPFHLAYTLAEALVSEAKRTGKEEGRECSTLTYHALIDSTIVDAGELLASYRSFTARPYRLHAPAEQHPTADPTTGSTTDSLQGAAWQAMLHRACHARGMTPSGTAFPRTRAARIRSLLSKRSALDQDSEQHQKLTGTIDAEWADARRVLGDTLIDGIDDPRYLPDLLELSDLLPTSYLEEALAGSPASLASPASSAGATPAATTTEEETA
ncbi:hypothetical protein ACSL103130_08650 [Actinomyces slackii]|uniref:CRISPR-associated protein Cas10/Cmr2, subtype III-B n=1 Tax=Actinomyces slackii TaxID=52774 RepID=A0A3S5EM56_9ACTO|nr:hypothetical protein [Actinomyces slackii]VEG74355.1 Uncharacterised protein [Actinomyces slackii]